MNIIAKNLKGGGKTLNYLLASVIALAAANVWAAKLDFISALEEGKEQTIVCYGTSLTEQGYWVAGLGEALNNRWPGKATVVNSGMSGKNSAVGLANVQDKVVSKSPDAVIIEFSMNDAADSLNTGKTPERALADAEANLKEIINAIKTAHPSCEIILQTMNPYVKAPGSNLSNRTGLEEHVNMYRRVAQEEGYLLIDNWPLWQQVLAQGEDKYLSLVPDGVHPGVFGSKRITLYNILKTFDLYFDCVFDKDYVLRTDEFFDEVSVRSEVTLNLAGNSLTCSSITGSGMIMSVGGESDLTSSDGVVDWSTNGDGKNAYGGEGKNLFNNKFPSGATSDNSERIMVKNVDLPLAVIYDFGSGNSQKVNEYKVYFSRAGVGYNARGPKEWTFEGSDDKKTWTILDSQTGVTWSSKNDSPKTCSFKNNVAYRYYRIKITASGATDYLELNQLEYFNVNAGELHVNVPEGDSVDFAVGISGDIKVVKEGGGTLSGITDIAVDSGSIVGLEVEKGRVVVDNSTLYVGRSGSGTLTINGGTVDVSSPDQNVNLAQNSGSRGTINLNGGTLKTRRIVKTNGASGVLNFNGGTLQANPTSNDRLSGGLISDTVTTIVNEGGGTIDSGNLEIKVGAAIGGKGAMRFKGGNTITLQGANSYEGGTTIELGTKVVTSVEAAKDTILGNLVIDGKSQLTDAKGIVVFQYSSELTAPDNLAYVELTNCGEGSTKYIDGNCIKVDFTAQAWELSAQKTKWSELVKHYGAPAADATVRIKAPDGYTLEIDQNLSVGQIAFSGKNPNVVVNSGCTVTVDTINFAAYNTDYYVLNNGVVVLNGTGVTTLNFHNDSRGVYYVNAGRLQVSGVTDGTTTPGLLPKGANQFVNVASGAMYDVHGIANNTASVRLASGATVANGGDDSVTTKYKQIPQLILDGDATACIYRSFGLVGSGDFTEHITSLNLGAHTLTINGGNNKYSFFLSGTSVIGNGKVVVENGCLAVYGNTHGEAWELEIGEEGKLVIGDLPANNSLTVGKFINNGTDESRDEEGTGALVVMEMLTPGNVIKRLTLADGATVKATGIPQVVSKTFSASGTIYADASKLDKAQLDEAADERIPVLTVPATFSHKGVTCQVVGSDIPGLRTRWETNEGGATKTLYVCRSSGTRIIVR